jgi:murein tripeptide amidase MpaA
MVALFGVGLCGVSTPALAEIASGIDNLIVRVYFDDLETAHRIAIWREPLESKYEKGYLVLNVTQEDYDRLIEAGLNVEVDIALMAQFSREPQALPPDTSTIPGYPCYRTVEETFATAQAIAANYPDLASLIDVGESWEKTADFGGYDMMVLRLTNTSIVGPKPKIFITSSIHAREYTPAELITRLAEFLVESYGIDADSTWMLDYHEVHMMLHANPDGRKKAETGLLWRKNTNQNYCSPTSNNRGADLNRNFQFAWNCCGGSSGFECFETYRGPYAASEPETQAIQDYIFDQFPDQRGPSLNDPAPDDATGIYLDIHSSGRLLLWPWGFTSNPAPNGIQLQRLGRKLAFFNGHWPQQSIGLYKTDGTTDAFGYGELGLASFVYELGTTFFEPCTYFENTLIPDNIPSLIYAIKVARTPYMTPAGPDAIDLSLSSGTVAPGVPAGTPVALRAIIDDSRFNNNNGVEPTQNIAAAEYYVDTPPWISSPTPVAIPMSPSDGRFNSKVENVEATIDTTGFSEGQHIIFVRGEDIEGNWGAFGAIFLYIDNNAPKFYLTPDATVIPRGETLSYWVTGINSTGATQCFDYWTNVTLPNRNTYPPSGQLFGPYYLCLSPYDSRSAHLTESVPMFAPLGTYSYNAFVGPYPTVWDEDHFGFTVTSGTQEVGAQV